MARTKTAMPRRENFLAAALTRFARDGYTGTSTRDICADVGLVHSAIYNYFDSKEAIVLAIEEREMLEMQAGLDAVVEHHQAQPDALLVAVVKYVIERALSRRQAWRLMNDMIRSLKPKSRAAVIERRDRFERVVRGVLLQAIEGGVIPQQDVELASLHLFGMTEGIAGWYKQNGRLGFQQIIDYSVSFFLRSIKAPGHLELDRSEAANSSRKSVSAPARPAAKGVRRKA